MGAGGRNQRGPKRPRLLKLAMKIETFRGGQDFFGPLNGTSDRKCQFWAKKVEAPSTSKSRDFHGVPHELAQVMDFPATK